MFGLTRFMTMNFTLNDCLFFGAIISATDPGNIEEWYNLFTIFAEYEIFYPMIYLNIKNETSPLTGIL